MAPDAERTEIARRTLEASQCALIVIDVQERLLAPIFEKERLLKNLQLLLRAAPIFNIPILATTQYAKGLGETVREVRSLLPQVEIDKQVFSCFASETFCSSLKHLPGRRNTVLLCGMESHICVMQTALDALREGYLVHVASDAVSSRSEWNWRLPERVELWQLGFGCGSLSKMGILNSHGSVRLDAGPWFSRFEVRKPLAQTSLSPLLRRQNRQIRSHGPSPAGRPLVGAPRCRGLHVIWL